MKALRILLVVNDAAPLPEQQRLINELGEFLQAQVGLLHLIDPGDISPISPCYDDLIDQLQRQGYAHLHRITNCLIREPLALYLRISRYPDRMIAAVANVFRADHIVLSATPPATYADLSLPDLTARLSLLTKVPVMALAPAPSQPRFGYPLCYN